MNVLEIGSYYGVLGSVLKDKVKNANKKQFYALVIALWWIPLGSFWSMAAIWLRYSSNIKKFFRLKR